MPTEFLFIRIGVRFLIVTLLPNIVFAALIAFLIAAGAPQGRPSWRTFNAALNDLSVVGAALLLMGVVVVSIAVYPLNLPLVQLIEGYWPASSPLVNDLRDALADAHHQRREQLVEKLNLGPSGGATPAELTDARHKVAWIPAKRKFTLPTALGNALRAGENRAGERYGMDTGATWPRLVRLLPPDERSQVADLRNQMDVAVRFCALGLVAVPITLALLMPYDTWLLVPVACYLFAWLSYRASISAAHRFCLGLAVAFDLHHLRLWDGLSLQRPPNLLAERRAADVLSRLLSDRPVSDRELRKMTYISSP